MNSLIILGVPRAGKSTLAKYVLKQLIQDGIPVTLLPADSLVGGLTAKRNGFMWHLIVRPMRHIFPFLRRQSKISLHRDLCRFIKRFFEETSSDFPIVFEGAYISPAQAEHLFNQNKCKIVVVGYPNADVQEKIADIKKFDNKSPISRLNDEQIHARIRNLINLSKQYQHESKNKFVFLDTSKEYHKTLCDFAKNISEFLKE